MLRVNTFTQTSKTSVYEIRPGDQWNVLGAAEQHFTGQMLFLLPNQQYQSTEGKIANRNFFEKTNSMADILTAASDSSMVSEDYSKIDWVASPCLLNAWSCFNNKHYSTIFAICNLPQT